MKFQNCLHAYKGVSIYFYVKQGEILQVSDAGKMWAILETTQSETYEDIGYKQK